MRNPETETGQNQLDNVTLLPLDITQPTQIADAVSKAIARGSIDVVPNNAAFGAIGSLEM